MAYNNVGFKVGTQSALNNLMTSGGALEGIFYLTNDTHRLYIGHSNGQNGENEKIIPIPVNEGIQFVNTINDLPNYTTSEDYSNHAGEFYYLSNTNVLCVYSGVNGWIQINTNTDTTVNGVTAAVTASNDIGSITYTVSSTNGAGPNDTFTLTGSNGIKITGSGKALTLAGDTYTLSSGRPENNTKDIQIKLDSTNTSNDSSVTIDAGNNITLTPDETNSTTKFTISAKDTTYSGLQLTATDQGFGVTMSSSAGATINNNGNNSIDPTVGYISTEGTGENSDVYTPVHFQNGAMNLPVYSKTIIDNKLKGLNAMTYRGVIHSTQSGAVATGFDVNTPYNLKNGENIVPVAIGDTFLAGENITYKGSTYEKGSLFIARGNEQNGIIISDLIFDVIEESNDTDTTYSLGTGNLSNGASASINASTGGNIGTIGVYSSTGDGLTISDGTASNSNDHVFRIKHNQLTNGVAGETNGTAVTQGDVNTATYTAITGLSIDAMGHVSSIEKTTLTVKDTNASLTALSNSASVAGNIATINTSATVSKANGSDSTQNDSFTLTSNNLTLTQTTNDSNNKGITINLNWGTFN